MTFFKQMVLLMSGFILLILLSIMLLNFYSATEQVQDQLYANAQDTVSSLSLSLGTTKGEASSIETMINAVYDSGYYKSIIFRDNEGNEVYSRVYEFLEEEKTPQWFKDIFTLIAPPALAHVSSGWSPIGILEVTSLESEAYASLYMTFVDILRSFIFISFVTFSLLFILLHIVLKSLKRVEEQAHAIKRSEFLTNDKIPFTTEFKNVTIAMNSMVSKVKYIFTKEAQTLKKYHELIYTDELTSLSNRKFLLLKLNEFLKSETAQSSGVLFFLSIENLLEENHHIGHKHVDELLEEFSEILTNQVHNFNDNLCTRIDGADFSIVLPGIDIQTATPSAKQILDLSQELFEEFAAKDLELYISIIHYNAEDDIHKIFARADYGLSKCKVQEPFSLYVNTEESPMSLLGKEEFMDIILKAMKEKHLSVALQAVVDTQNNTVLHEEAYLRLIEPKKKVFSAGDFMPIIYALDLQVDVDKYIIKQVVSQDEYRDSPIAINLSLDFINDSANIQWLYDFLKPKHLKHPLYFELSNSVLIDNIEASKHFSKMLHGIGHHFGIDRFTLSEHGLDYLQELVPDYIKIDQDYLHGLIDNENDVAKNALQNIITTLNIKLISCSVETNEQKEWLLKQPYFLMQGNFITDTKLIKII